MEKDRYMRLSDEEKDKVRMNYHRDKKQEQKGPVKTRTLTNPMSSVGEKKDEK